MSGRKVLLVAVVVGLVPVVAVAGPAPDGKVQVATTIDPAEERELVPISRKPRDQPKVAISMSQKELPRLRDRDLVRISAEVETTNNCRRPGRICVTKPYAFDPRVGTQLILARGRSDTGGGDTVPLTPRRQRTCRQREPHREHHCVEVLRADALRLDEGDLPCRLDRCVINLVVDAHHPNATGREHVILGVDRPGGHVHQARGRINVTRFRKGGVEAREQRTKRRLRQRVDVEEGRPRVLYSLKLRKLKRDEQLTFTASATLGVGHLPYDVFTGSQLVLTDGPHKTWSTAFAKSVARRPSAVNRQLGFNCTKLKTPCGFRRVGALSMTKDAVRNGNRVPLYVNYVLRTAPKRADDRPGDVVRIKRGGFIKSLRYPAEARGKR